MKFCTYCGKENDEALVHCSGCGTAMQPPELPPRLPPEQRKALRAIIRARVMMWLCAFLLIGPVVLVMTSLFTLAGPDSAFAGMAMLYNVMMWGPLLFIPLVGMVLALNSKRTAQTRLEHLQKGSRLVD